MILVASLCVLPVLAVSYVSVKVHLRTMRMLDDLLKANLSLSEKPAAQHLARVMEENDKPTDAQRLPPRPLRPAS